MSRLLERGSHDSGFTIQEMPKSTKEVVEKEILEELKKEEVYFTDSKVLNY